MAIVVDMSHLMYRHLFASKDLVIENPNIVAHLLLSSLFSIVNRFEVSTGNPLVAAFDGRRKEGWRHEFYEKNSANFPEYSGHSYKSNRKKDMELPWPDIYKVVDSVREVLGEASDVQPIFHPKAEADDIIYAATRFYKDQEVTIISSDRDFHQLVGPMVRQYDPIKKKQVGLDNSKEKLLLDILTGQGRKDNIFPCAERLGPKTAEKKVKNLKGYLETDTPLRKRFIFNTNLIDLSKVPDWIIEDLQVSFDRPHYNYNFNRMLEFFRKYNLRKLSDRIDHLHFKKTTNVFEALE